MISDAGSEQRHSRCRVAQGRGVTSSATGGRYYIGAGEPTQQRNKCPAPARLTCHSRNTSCQTDQRWMSPSTTFRLYFSVYIMPDRYIIHAFYYSQHNSKIVASLGFIIQYVPTYVFIYCVIPIWWWFIVTIFLFKSDPSKKIFLKWHEFLIFWYKRLSIIMKW